MPHVDVQSPCDQQLYVRFSRIVHRPLTCTLDSGSGTISLVIQVQVLARWSTAWNCRSCQGLSRHLHAHLYGVPRETVQRLTPHQLSVYVHLDLVPPTAATCSHPFSPGVRQPFAA